MFVCFCGIFPTFRILAAACVAKHFLNPSGEYLSSLYRHVAGNTWEYFHGKEEKKWRNEGKKKENSQKEKKVQITTI